MQCILHKGDSKDRQRKVVRKLILMARKAGVLISALLSYNIIIVDLKMRPIRYFGVKVVKARQ